MPGLVRRAVREYALWRAGDGVLVGVSGGPDSTALLAVVAELPSALRPRVVAAHFDHGLRGEESAADARFAAGLASRIGVPFTAGGTTTLRSQAGSVEAAARHRRYAFLTAEARRHGCCCVAVGHHRDDQVETLLLRLFRGAGSTGLAAMAPSRPLADDRGTPIRLVRPLFLADRGDVLAYLRDRGLPWREDSSNRDPAHARNRVRVAVLPAMEAAFGPRLRQRLWRASQNLRGDATALAALAGDAARRRMRGGALDVASGWEDLPKAVRIAELRAWWAMVGSGPALRADVVDRLDRLRDGGALRLRGGLAVRRSGSWLQTGAPPASTLRIGDVPLPVNVPGTTEVAGFGEIRAALADWPNEALRRERDSPTVALGDADALPLPLRLRRPRPGERVSVLGASGRRRVRDLLAEAGVPRQRRAAPWVVEDGAGRPLWVLGARQAAGFRVEGGTSRVLVLRWRPTEDTGEPSGEAPVP